MASQKMSIDEKLDIANRYKEEGNALYKKKEFKQAIGKYSRATLYLKGIDTDLHGTPAFLQAASVNPDQKNCITKEQEKQCIQLNISVHNNLAMCMLQQDNSNFERVKHLAEVVIELDKNNEKAWFRHGQACVKLKDIDTALDSFKQVVSISGGANKEAVKSVKECEIKLQGQKLKEKRMYEEMFKPRVD